MASEGVYVSLTSEEQRKYRSDLLLIQSDVLKLMKKLSEIEEIRVEKKECTKKLAQEYLQLITRLKVLDSEMPSPKMPKSAEPKVKEIKVKVEKIKKEKEQPKQSYNLEDELVEIQRQLKMLTESV